jgi:hypothetical protein
MLIAEQSAVVANSNHYLCYFLKNIPIQKNFQRFLLGTQLQHVIFVAMEKKNHINIKMF